MRTPGRPLNSPRVLAVLAVIAVSSNCNRSAISRAITLRVQNGFDEYIRSARRGHRFTLQSPCIQRRLQAMIMRIHGSSVRLRTRLQQSQCNRIVVMCDYNANTQRLYREYIDCNCGRNGPVKPKLHSYTYSKCNPFAIAVLKSDQGPLTKSQGHEPKDQRGPRTQRLCFLTLYSLAIALEYIASAPGVLRLLATQR